MNFPKYYIGPMSKNVVDCVIDHSKQHPIGLIPSRRQVDWCGGYVNKWNTESFTEYVREKSDSVLLCRDHGGENQGLEQDDGLTSFTKDNQNFNLIHIDPFRVSNNMLDAAKCTTTIIQCLYESNKDTMYEVGTEEAIYKYQPDELKWFLEYLKMGLGDAFNQIKYAVVQSGTGLDLSTRTNTGNFSKRRLKNFIKVVKKYGVMSKEHNGDYLTDSFDVELRFECGLDAINIAPEFGQIESEFYLNECKKDKKLFEELYQLCYTSNKWRKWIKDVKRVSKSQIIMTCCHYILSNQEFKNKIACNFPHSESSIKSRINSKLKLLNEQTKNYCF
jgi:hypothetical protein